MSDTIFISSRVRDYNVYFRETVDVDIAKAYDEGAFFIIDAHVNRLYGNLLSHLSEKRVIILDPTEQNKSLDQCKNLIEHLVEKRIRRNNTLVAIGGGIVQDITAFTASVLYRGIEWTFIPTTLLAQGDSCIGGKTSINLGRNKNLIGNFYPPSAVFIDTKFLKTLDEGDVQSGLGEMMHFYVYDGSAYLEKMVRHYHELIAERSKLREYIQESLSIKKRVIEVDEFDRDERNKFNYGHTFGHALEAVSNYEIRHGQAVTVGMDLANYIATNYGIMDQDTFGTLHHILKTNIPQYDYCGIDLDGYLNALSRDKKNVGNDLVCILAERPGKLIKHQMTMDGRFQAVIREYFQRVLS